MDQGQWINSIVTRHNIPMNLKISRSDKESLLSTVHASGFGFVQSMVHTITSQAWSNGLYEWAHEPLYACKDG